MSPWPNIPPQQLDNNMPPPRPSHLAAAAPAAAAPAAVAPAPTWLQANARSPHSCGNSQRTPLRTSHVATSYAQASAYCSQCARKHPSWTPDEMPGRTCKRGQVPIQWVVPCTRRRRRCRRAACKDIQVADAKSSPGSAHAHPSQSKRHVIMQARRCSNQSAHNICRPSVIALFHMHMKMTWHAH